MIQTRRSPWSFGVPLVCLLAGLLLAATHAVSGGAEIRRSDAPRLVDLVRETQAAVNRLNALSEQLAKLDFAATPAATMSELKREEHSVYNSTILHELYFESLGEAPTRPSGVFAEALARDFGSLDRWRAEFAATGKALDGGSGWVILTYAPRDKRLFNHWCADDGMAPAGGVPLLVLDMDKHAYATDYGAEVGKYVDSFMPMIRWTTPERLYREAIRV